MEANGEDGGKSATDTEVIYYIDEEDAPYGTKIPKAADFVTLADFKAILPARLHRYKYFFKNKDAEFGIVKQEIVDDNSKLPLFNGKVVSWLVASEGSMVSEAVSGLERGPGVGQTRPPSFHGHLMLDDDDDTESAITSVSQQAANVRSRRMPRPSNQARHHGHMPPPLPGPGIPAPGSRVPTETTETSSSMMSSEIESSIYESEDVQSQASSRFTTSTDHTSVSRQLMMRHRQKKRSRRKVPAHLARAGSMSSVTDSTMSLNIITVNLNMDTVNFLGISIVGQSNRDGKGDCGIYVGSIMKGGAVALDGRIDPGDMILQVNEINFEDMTNDEAVQILKEVVQKPGPIKLVVAKCWDPNPGSSAKGGFLTLPRSEPVRPIDPGAWVAHTAAVRGDDFGSVFGDPVMIMGGSSRDPLLGDFMGRAPSVTTLSNSSIVSSQAETEKYLGMRQRPTTVDGRNNSGLDLQQQQQQLPLTINSGMHAILRKMRAPNSGLEVKDRTWLKLKIPNAFLGADLVHWLLSNVESFQDRREARKFAVHMLKGGFIKDTVNKSTFSEQCYYTFGNEANISDSLGQINLNDSGLSRETVEPQLTTLPMGSGGSGGSGGGIWGVGMTSQPPAGPPMWTDMPWTGPPSTGSTTTYGPIYNPSAPPPSANYGTYHGLAGGHHPNLYGGQQPLSVSSGSGSHRSNNRLMLAGSGSGSESASDGRASSVLSTEKSSLLRNQGLIRSGPEGNPFRPQAVFQGQ